MVSLISLPSVSIQYLSCREEIICDIIIGVSVQSGGIVNLLIDLVAYCIVAHHKVQGF